jgi:hypothetical protein
LIISVGAQQVVSQRVGEAWLLMLASGLVMLALSYILALTRNELRTNSL